MIRVVKKKKKRVYRVDGGRSYLSFLPTKACTRVYLFVASLCLIRFIISNELYAYE